MQKFLARGALWLVLILCVLATAGISLLLESQVFVFNKVTEEKATAVVDASPFPVSVDPVAQTIADVDPLLTYDYETFAMGEYDKWQNKVAALFFTQTWYQSLASPVSRVLVIWPGERKEEVAQNIGDVLAWDRTEREEFITLITTADPALLEGTFYPGQYIAHRGATPAEVAALIQEKFETDILSRYTDDVAAQVPLEDALIIASLLEREASDFENMREISGVIWNRLFIDMPLQLDATLQYVRGSKPTEKRWWPQVRPADKYLKSPFNTYANKGLPPAPISNVSSAAVLAALNPYPTDCLYYFHDKRQGYHCSVTYEEHVRKLKQQYGKGK